MDHLVTRNWSCPGTVDAVPLLRSAVCDFAEQAGVPDPPLADVRLAVSEALTNAVIHGYRSAADPGPVAIDAELSGEELRVVVSDRGIGMEPRTDSPGSGFGLPLIAQVTEGYDIRRCIPRGTEIHMRFRLSS